MVEQKRSKSKIFYGWFIAIGCCFMMAGGLGLFLDAGIGAFVQPVITADDVAFASADPALRQGELMIYMSCYFLATIIAMPLVGHVLPRYNIRVTLTVAYVVTAAAFCACGFYTEVWMWYISGFVFGLAGNFVFVMPVPILIGNWFNKRRALVLGVVSCFSGIGGALLAPLFTFFINELGWRDAYMASALVGCVMVLPFTLLVIRFKPEDMGLRPYGWTEEAARETTGYGKSRASSSSSSGVIANKAAVVSIPFICMFLICGLVSFYGSLGTLMNPFGFSLGFFGDDVAANRMFGATLVSAVMVGNIVSKVVMGFVTDYIGVYRAIIIQLGLVIVGLLGFIFLNQQPWLLYVWGFLFGVQNSVYAVSTPLLIRDIFGSRDYSKIFSWCRIGTGAIGFIGPTMYGFLVGWGEGSYLGCFTVSILVGLVCITAVILGQSTKKKLVWVNGGVEREGIKDVNAAAIGIVVGNDALKDVGAKLDKPAAFQER